MNPAPKVGVLVVAYNAASTLTKVLDRIPAEIRPSICEVLVSDDHSSDDTYLVGLGYKDTRGHELPLTVIRQPQNLGYGGNQKVGYRHAIANGWDIAVLLHGDGQYAPEAMPDLVAPLDRGEAEAVFGSRMMERGGALRGGMPKYKFVGNKILTTAQNALSGLNLSEWHSGYRAYSVDALRRIDFESNSDVFDFDTEIILQLHGSGARIAEVPIPTYYGDEICNVDGVRYGFDVLKDTAQFALERAGLGPGRLAQPEELYSEKLSDSSSHRVIADWMSTAHPQKVLDVGCGPGYLAAELRRLGHEVTGVDVIDSGTVRANVSHFVQADLTDGLPAGVADDFDTIVCADVIEHLASPDALIDSVVAHLKPGGRILLSVPNVGHWYPRIRAVTGNFDYDQRGILDSTHLRFFTLASLRRLLRKHGLAERRIGYTGMPIENLSSNRPFMETAGVLSRFVRRLRPQLFAYQIVVETQPQGRAMRASDFATSATAPA